MTALIPKGAGAVMAARREPPDSLDFFPTPPWATRALMRHVLPAIEVSPTADRLGTIWEPCCGAGHMSDVLAEFTGGMPVIASDVFDGYGYGKGGIDFLDRGRPLVIDPDLIISNPPFKAGLAITLRALELARTGVAMLVRTQWIEGGDRYRELFAPTPPTVFAPFVERVPMTQGMWDPDASTATAYAWLVWIKDAAPRAPFWIPPGCRKALTRPDDRARFAAWSLAPENNVTDFEALLLRHASRQRANAGESISGLLARGYLMKAGGSYKITGPGRSALKRHAAGLGKADAIAAAGELFEAHA